MAACVPTLPPGYKWLCKRLKPRQSSSTAHLPLAENPGFQFAKPPNDNHSDHDISNALRSDTESARVFPDRIQRTIRVDVERRDGENGADNGVSRGGSLV